MDSMFIWGLMTGASLLFLIQSIIELVRYSRDKEREYQELKQERFVNALTKILNNTESNEKLDI